MLRSGVISDLQMKFLLAVIENFSVVLQSFYYGGSSCRNFSNSRKGGIKPSLSLPPRGGGAGGPHLSLRCRARICEITFQKSLANVKKFHF